MSRKRLSLPLGLALLNAALVIGLVLTSLGPTGAVGWSSDSRAVPALASPSATPRLAPLPDSQLAGAWEQPLFSPGRRPDAPAAQEASAGLEGISLGGVVTEGETQWALLHLPARHPVKLKRGEALAGGWTLTALTAASATFSRQGQARTLTIPVLRLPMSPLIKHLDVHAP